MTPPEQRAILRRAFEAGHFDLSRPLSGGWAVRDAALLASAEALLGEEMSFEGLNAEPWREPKLSTAFLPSCYRASLRRKGSL